MAQKGYTNKKPKPPELREISAAGGGVAQSTQDLLKPSDTLLQAKGGDYKIYEDVLRDDQVAATLQQRRGALVAREWYVEPADDSAPAKAAAEALEENLREIAFDRITRQMHFGVFYGYSVGECLWAKSADGNRIELADVKVRKRARFAFGQDGTLRLLTKEQPKGIVMPERKFWTFATGHDHGDDPYGLGLAHWLYWPVFFKRNDIRFWLIFLEKFGQPTTVGTYPPSATKDEQDKVLEAAAAVAMEAAVALPEGFKLELLEAARSGTGDYETMAEFMNGAISKVVLSQTMTTDDGSSLAQAQVHAEVADNVVKEDSDLLCESFNCGPAQWLTEWNFPGVEPPRLFRRLEDDPDLKPVAERDKLLADIGFKPTQAYIDETYGEGFVEKQAPDPSTGAGAPATPDGPNPDDPAPREPSGAGFAEPSERREDDIDALVAASLEEWADVTDPVMQPLRDLVNGAASLEEVRDRLPEILTDMNTDALTERLAQAMFAGRLAGDFES